MSRVVVVTKDGYDYSRMVSDWIEDFYRRTGHKIEVIDPDKETGFCEAYDIVEYPTILALDNNNAVLASWRGRQLPLFNEILYYLI